MQEQNMRPFHCKIERAIEIDDSVLLPSGCAAQVKEILADGTVILEFQLGVFGKERIENLTPNPFIGEPGKTPDRGHKGN